MTVSRIKGDLKNIVPILFLIKIQVDAFLISLTLSRIHGFSGTSLSKKFFAWDFSISTRAARFESAPFSFSRLTCHLLGVRSVASCPLSEPSAPLPFRLALLARRCVCNASVPLCTIAKKNEVEKLYLKAEF